MTTGPFVVSSLTQYSGGHFSGREPLVVSADGIAGSCILSLLSQPIVRPTMATRNTHFETRDTFVPPPTRPMNQAPKTGTRLRNWITNAVPKVSGPIAALARL